MDTISMNELENVSGGADFAGDAKTFGFYTGLAGAASAAFTKVDRGMSTFNTGGRRALIGMGLGVAAAGAKWAYDKATGQ